MFAKTLLIIYSLFMFIFSAAFFGEKASNWTLRGLVFRVWIAKSGLQGLEALQTLHWRVWSLDWKISTAKLPQKEVTEACKRINLLRRILRIFFQLLMCSNFFKNLPLSPIMELGLDRYLFVELFKTQCLLSTVSHSSTVSPSSAVSPSDYFSSWLSSLLPASGLPSGSPSYCPCCLT